MTFSLNVTATDVAVAHELVVVVAAFVVVEDFVVELEEPDKWHVSHNFTAQLL